MENVRFEGRLRPNAKKREREHGERRRAGANG